MPRAVAESCFRRLWRERIRRRTYSARNVARRDVFEHIVSSDTPTRKRTNTGILSPVDFELRQQKLNQPSAWETRGHSVRLSFTAFGTTRALNPASGVLRGVCPELPALEDWQTSDRNFRHCPILGEKLTSHTSDRSNCARPLGAGRSALGPRQQFDVPGLNAPARIQLYVR
jgi:putative transposase